jgi:hypothetical protein
LNNGSKVAITAHHNDSVVIKDSASNNVMFSFDTCVHDFRSTELAHMFDILANKLNQEPTRSELIGAVHVAGYSLF